MPLRSRPSLFHFWTLDMRTGDIVQKIPVNGTPPMAAGFEGGDSTGQRVQISGDEGARDGVVFFARLKTL
ncbi:MAG: hypothetical protein WCP07_12560 [bacterium]